MKKYCVFDLETTGEKTYGRFCNPLDPNHWINIVSYSLQGQEPIAYYNKNNYAKGITAEEVVKQLHLDEVKLLIGQNVKFDFLWLWGVPELQDWLRNGGQIWDTRTVEYFLRNQFLPQLGAGHNTSISLDALATKYGGTLKDDKIKELYKAGYKSCDIDPNILIPYALEDSRNTEIVFLAQLKQVKERKLGNFIKAQMDHYLATIEMEYNGLHVDIPRAYKELENLNKELENIQSKINEELGTIIDLYRWPSNVPFSESSIDDVSKLLFGGVAYVKEDKEVLDPESGNPILYKSGIKKGLPKTKKEEVEVKITGLGANPLFIPKNKKGLYKVTEDILAQFTRFDIIKLILDSRKLRKLIGTYYLSDDGKVKKGMLSMVSPATELVHPEYNTCATITGRLSSANPNGQNLPKEVLSLFNSRFVDGKIISYDYSQLEVVVQAYLSQSERFIKDVASGVDFHIKRLSYSVGKSYEEVKKLVETSEQWKEKRRAAKTVSFQKAYGAQPAKISESTGLSIEIVEKIFKAEDEEYPEVGEFYKDVLEKVGNSTIPTAIPLQIRDKEGNYFTRPGEYMYIGEYLSLTGKSYTFTQRAVLTKTGSIFRYYKMPDIQNYPVQGLAADIVSTCVGRVYRFLNKHRDKALMVNEVHDSLLIDCKQEYIDFISPEVHRILSDVKGALQERFGLVFNVPISVDCGIGNNWGEAK